MYEHERVPRPTCEGWWWGHVEYKRPHVMPHEIVLGANGWYARRVGTQLCALDYIMRQGGVSSWTGPIPAPAVAPPEDPGHEGVRGDPARIDEHGMVETGVEEAKPPVSDEELGLDAWEAVKRSLWPNSFTPNLGAVGAAIRAALAGE